MKDLLRLQDTPEYQAYLWAKGRVLGILEGQDSSKKAGSAPSDYWREELENFDYLLDASPLIVRKLRHHCFHITGLRVYDYRTRQDAKQRNLESRLRELIAVGGRELLLPEARELGGFGYEIDGELYNVDTLKFFEFLIGMDKGGILSPLRNGSERRVVCEIGSGWGGFAYQFKVLFPNVTYILVDLPELFLFSAVYLKSLFPQARMAFHGEVPDSELYGGEGGYDFIFVPNTCLDAMRPHRLDLMMNMVSFQEMTTEQVRAYAKAAADLGCPSVYSLNRDRGPYNNQITSVREVLAEFYELEELEVLGSSYTSATKSAKTGAGKNDKKEKLKEKGKEKEKEKDELTYRHVAGRLRRGGIDLSPSAREAVPSAPEIRSPAEAPVQPATVRVGIGMTVYNGARYIEQTLESLLSQSYRDFALIVLDDASTDGSGEIVQRYAERDPRILYLRNETRLGMIETWCKIFDLACQRIGGVEYFAWASDHDVWTPEWLGRMVDVLDENPGAVLAYPRTRIISADGQEEDKETSKFDTARMASLQDRFAYASRHMGGAGNMVYGLVRVPALRSSGVYRRILLPDRLLIAELSLRGEVHLVPDVSWLRRKFQRSADVIPRQRRSLVAGGRTPFYMFLPWWLAHGFSLIWNYGVDRRHGLPVGRAEILRMALSYMRIQAGQHGEKRLRLKQQLIERKRRIVQRSLRRGTESTWRNLRKKNKVLSHSIRKRTRGRVRTLQKVFQKLQTRAQKKLQRYLAGPRRKSVKRPDAL